MKTLDNIAILSYSFLSKHLCFFLFFLVHFLWNTHTNGHTHISYTYCLAGIKSFSTSSQYMSRIGESGNSHRRILFGNMEANWEDAALKRLTQSQTWIIWWYLECTVLWWERQTPGLRMSFLCLTPLPTLPNKLPSRLIQNLPSSSHPSSLFLIVVSTNSTNSYCVWVMSLVSC